MICPLRGVIGPMSLAQVTWSTQNKLQNQFEGRDDISPQELRDAGIYGGGRGIWRNKSKTGNLTSDGSGVVVSVLHLGQRYANDLHHDGIVYHFPNNSTAGYDLGDIKSIQNCFTLGIPLFVISHGKTKSLRKLHFGKIVDFGSFVFLASPRKAMQNHLEIISKSQFWIRNVQT